MHSARGFAGACSPRAIRVLGLIAQCLTVAPPRSLARPALCRVQAGTLSGNPLAMVAGIKTLEILGRPGAYEHLDKVTKRLINGILDAAKESGHAMCGGSISGMFGFFFCEGPVSSFEDAKASGARPLLRVVAGLCRACGRPAGAAAAGLQLSRPFRQSQQA